MAYVQNTQLLEALLESHRVGHVTDECYHLFEEMSIQRINTLFKYDRAKHFEEVKIQCIDKCLKIWHSYSFERDNAFAYFVSVIDNCIKLYWIVNNVTVVSIEEQEQRFKDSD